MDMKYHWLQCRESQGHFRHYWASGKTSNGDYVTKHHGPIHHQATRPIFLTPIKILQELRGRVTNRPWVFFLEERFSIGHGPTPLAYIPTYIRTFHSTPQQSGVEWILSSTPKKVPLHLRAYLHTNVHYTPLAYVPTYERMFPIHSTSQSGVEQKKSMSSYKKPDDEKITRRWKSHMLKILPDTENTRRRKNCQTLKKHQIYSP